jgi:hypothetical protein
MPSPHFPCFTYSLLCFSHFSPLPLWFLFCMGLIPTVTAILNYMPSHEYDYCSSTMVTLHQVAILPLSHIYPTPGIWTEEPSGSSFCLFWDRVSLCIPGWPWTLDLLPQSNQVLGLQACTTKSGSIWFILTAAKPNIVHLHCPLSQNPVLDWLKPHLSFANLQVFKYHSIW